MPAFIVLGASILLQFVAAGLALSLIRTTGRFTAWSLIAAAIILMAVRRLVTFASSLAATPPVPPHLPSELVALGISVLMVAGLALVRPLFQAIRDNELRLGQLMDGVADAIFVCDSEGRFVDANRQALRSTGYERGNLLSLTVPDIDIGFDIEQATHIWEQVMAGEQVTFESRHRRRDGTTFPVEVSLTATRLQGREMILGVVRDITERHAAADRQRRAVEQLIRSNAGLDRFTYVATHDLQEPLRGITTYAQRLEREFGDRLPPEAKDYLRFVVNGARRMRDLVGALVAFSRASLKSSPFQRVPLDGAVAAALATLAPSLEEARAEVRVDGLPEVSGDAAQLALLMQHLLSNALQYRRPGVAPRIMISAARRPETGDWEIAVADNGLGIEPCYHEVIFQPFKRLHTQEAFPGTGVGLALCKTIAERHGGAIALDSVPGEGSTFRIILPAIRDGEAA